MADQRRERQAPSGTPSGSAPDGFAQKSPGKRSNGGRRGRGEGSIYQRKDGLWAGCLNLGYDLEGKRKKRVIYGKTRLEVHEKLVQLQAQSLTGTMTEPNRLTLGQFMTQWLEDSVRQTVRASTYRIYDLMTRHHILPYIGHFPIMKLTPAIIQSYYAELGRGSLARSSQHKIHNVLKMCLDRAVQWSLVQRNPCKLVDAPPKQRRPEIKVWTAQEARKFLQAAQDDRLYAIYVLALTTGMRKGEIIGLQWSDIDLKGQYLTVRRIVVQVRGKNFVTEPKTPSSRRRIDLPAVAVQALHEHKRKMAAEGWAVPWVFVNQAGTPIYGNALGSRDFPRLVMKAQVPRIKFHDQRHTAATLMLMEGIHPKVVQERLGHSSISMTLDTYSHVLPSMQREAADRIDRIFASARGV